MKKFKVLAFLLLPFFCISQDVYHQSIIDNLLMNYGLENGVFIFPDTEDDVFNNIYEYGDITTSNVTTSDLDFTLSKQISVSNAGNNPWDAGIGINTQLSISQGDMILLTFWARNISNSSQVALFAEESTTYAKEIYFPITFTQDWTQYFVAFRSSSNFNVGRLQAGFHLASQAQDIEIAGFNALNFKDAYDLNDLPSSFSPYNYDGRELDAPWRALAENRIENLRKADLNILVVDEHGSPVEGADVKVEMQQHDFGFGSALVTCKFPGNNCYDETYVSKVLDLDGQGHRFNECVNENSLKWRVWEQEWLGTPEETVSAFRWLTENDITMRGHNLFWPGSDWLPQDINDNLDDIEYLRTRIDNRIEEMIAHPELRNYVRDWDVLNEITTNRTLESAFNSDTTLQSGRKLYNELYRKVRDLDPELELYINDYMAISSGSANLVARYKGFLDELKADDVPFDGIGFQCHIGSVPNGIPQVEQIFNDFYQRYGKRMKVTEYDIDRQVDELTQADYMRDILTLTFSHPGMDAFIMWGFYDGNHWKDNAPMFYEDWSLKLSGEVFIQKVFNDWWTDMTLSTDSQGAATLRAFKGKHLITVSKNDVVETVELEFTSDSDINIVLSTNLTTTSELNLSYFTISPNPISDSLFSIEFADKYEFIDLKVIDTSGKTIANYENVRSGELLEINAFPGAYFFNMKAGHLQVQKLIIIK